MAIKIVEFGGDVKMRAQTAVTHLKIRASHRSYHFATYQKEEHTQLVYGTRISRIRPHSMAGSL